MHSWPVTVVDCKPSVNRHLCAPPGANEQLGLMQRGNLLPISARSSRVRLFTVEMQREVNAGKYKQMCIPKKKIATCRKNVDISITSAVRRRRSREKCHHKLIVV